MLSTLSEQPELAQMAPQPAAGVPACGITSPAPPAPPARSAPVTDQMGLSKPVARIRGGLPPRALRRVREYIDAHLDKTISIVSLTSVADLSMFHFARAFKQSEGVTPHDYLIQRRVKRAMELVAGTDLPLSEIAVAVGFSDQSHCARRFREHVGVCPRDYRWLMR